MTVIRACIRSDLMYLLTISATFVCVIEARGQTQFLFFLNILDVFKFEGVHRVFGHGCCFLNKPTYQAFLDCLENR